jgi:competence ComEA-like helix-hairpin-helix protein
MKQNSPAKTRVRLWGLLVLVPVMIFSACATNSRNSNAKLTSLNEPTGSAQSGNWRININKASVQDLEKLPGIGTVLAERIVAHRNQHGPFQRVEHLMLVKGISEKKFHDIERMITVE